MKAMLFLLFGVLLASVPAEEGASPATTAYILWSEDSCLPCFVQTEPLYHYFMCSQALCDEPREREQNGCELVPMDEECGVTYQNSGCPSAQCEGPEKDGEELAEVLLHESRDELGRLLRERPDLFEFNAERSAIQTLGCDGRVVGHFPVSRSLVLGL